MDTRKTVGASIEIAALQENDGASDISNEEVGISGQQLQYADHQA